MIEWKQEAIEAADQAYHQNMANENSFDFWRIVLNAAVTAQGLIEDAEAKRIAALAETEKTDD